MTEHARSRSHDVLRLMLGDMERAPPEFLPTNFWQSGLRSVVADLESRGFEDFRAHPSAHVFYVPLYGRKSFAARHAALRPFLDRNSRLLPQPVRLLLDHYGGMSRARADYRVFRAADTSGAPRLGLTGESAEGSPVEQFAFDGARYSRVSLNYLRGLAYLKKTANVSSLRSTLEIGGGFGTLGEILTHAIPGHLYVDVDIPPVAAVATHYLSRVFGEEAVLAYDQTRTMDEIDLGLIARTHRIVVLCPWQLPQLKGTADLFVNFISFQEMEPSVVANYVRLVQPRTARWALLRNSRRGKPVAARPGELGVFRQVTTDFLASAFDEFALLGRDVLTFGDVGPDGNESEILCLERRGQAS